MTTESREQWQARQIRRPGDVPLTTPLAWMVDKHSEAGLRLLNNVLPANFPYKAERGTAADTLTQLALGEKIVWTIGHYKGCTVHEALELAATWTEVAAALGINTEQARDVLRSYADGQRRLYLSYEADGYQRPVGFTAERHEATLALIALQDDTPAPAGRQAQGGAPDRSTPRSPRRPWPRNR